MKLQTPDYACGDQQPSAIEAPVRQTVGRCSHGHPSPNIPSCPSSIFSINAFLSLQSVRERIEDKRKAVLGAMSPSIAMELSSQRSAQQPFTYSSPFVDQGQARATQLTSPSMSPFSDLGSIRTTPVASSPGQGLYEEMGSRMMSSPGSEQHQQEPKQPTSLADRLRTSLTG